MVSGGLAVTALAGCGGSDGGTEQSAQTEVSEGIKTAAEDNKVTTFALPDGSEESEIYVEPIADLPDDFIRGKDASAVLSLENSGVTYYNYEGKEQDVFETLAQSGVNYIRLRVWNDPYDADGNGYGGGNNDVATAVALGKRATAYGMKVCVDFHYSDFWADPKRQHAPKAWEGMSASEKSEALYDFTKESLAELLDAGVDVGMVQVGNEINNGMAGEEDVDTVMDLIASGSRAVREIAKDYGKDIKVAVHYTNIEDYEEVDTRAANLQNAGGFETPDKGQVLFDGKDITALPPNERDLNTVFQKYALFPHMSIAENIAFGLKIKKKQGIHRRQNQIRLKARKPGRIRAPLHRFFERRPAAENCHRPRHRQ